MIQQIDSLCDYCEQLAVWRVRNSHGGIVAAACADHKDQRKADLYARLKLPTTTREPIAPFDDVRRG